MSFGDDRPSGGGAPKDEASKRNTSVTKLLYAWRAGDLDARDALVAELLASLRLIARRHLRHERPSHTLQPTEIVNELYLKLIEQRELKLESRGDFFAMSAELIRRILVDHARKKLAEKRGAGLVRVPLGDALEVVSEGGIVPDLVHLDDALKDLEKVDPRGAKVIELHIFSGMTFDEVAEHLGVARSTVLRDWRYARRWLARYLKNAEAQEQEEVTRDA